MCFGSKKNKAEVKKPVPEVVQTPEAKVLLVGHSAVGKTAIINQYVNGTFSG